MVSRSTRNHIPNKNNTAKRTIRLSSRSSPEESHSSRVSKMKSEYLRTGGCANLSTQCRRSGTSHVVLSRSTLAIIEPTGAQAKTLRQRGDRHTISKRWSTGAKRCSDAYSTVCSRLQRRFPFLGPFSPWSFPQNPAEFQANRPKVVVGRGARQAPASHLCKLPTEGPGYLERLPIGQTVA
jgi:hypothetical protein